MSRNIIFQYFIWQFLDAPKNILKGWKNFLKFGLYYFSVGLLLKTLFSPWHRYKWNYPRGFSFSKYSEVFFSNLISRILGGIMRIILIITGLFFEIFLILAGLFVFLIWVFLPAILVYGFYFGFRILF